MRTKLPQLTDEEKKERFKECIFSLDPAISLNNNFINGIESFVKRYNSKATYFSLIPDKFRRIEAKVSSTGTRVSLKLKTGYFSQKVTWSKKHPEKNEEVIESYKHFKEEAAAEREKEEQNKILSDKKNKMLDDLKGLIPKNSKIQVSSYYSSSEDFSFAISIARISQEKTEAIIQKIKDIV